MFRNAVSHHTAGLGHGLINTYLITVLRKKISCSKPCRTGADDSDLFVPWFYLWYGYLVQVRMIGSHSFKLPYRNRFIQFKTATAFFAGMRTHASKCAGQWEILHDNLNGFSIFALLHHLNIALHVQISRTGHSARGFVQFLNSEPTGDSLGIGFKYSPASNQIHVVFTGPDNRADLRAVSASGTRIKLNKTRSFLEGYTKIARFTVYVFNI